MTEKDPREPLGAAQLRQYLSNSPPLGWESVEVIEETGSTNADLLERAARGPIARRVLIADHQTQGKGRLGRRWEAPPRTQIALSFGVAFDRSARAGGPELGWLPLAVGLSVGAMLAQYFDSYRSISGVPVPEPSLKWPNDVLVGDRKIAGVLVQLSPKADEAVVGVGLNVDQHEDELPVPTATSLRIEQVAAARQQLVPLLLMELDRGLDRWLAQDPGLADAYRAHCSTLGQDVRVALPGGNEIFGRASSVDDHGRLVVALADGTARVVDAGDVQHVRPVGPA
ncbi:biotin/acetyl-CoA-carboxylase ligase [Segniliparus rotundus DSM 44985]|uniref:biotin--[biotin carboxyl-carrier protein] ligase n=1 Tax=Segniliparus rotundus (strain ATCC BAA-972 / CDC 1076 / CIP 108378 / DSM 44985 / JCM 13578) TaxID=640132 RepID=D6ZED1_SEGRD|nr:biotin--[acetyl-CoA-carboxylase] ligase [Segniliparus rotundus]ADG99407.1 biotin/acetyl-CoA-carboxylase ligase [Segniliparus rotundus DSM 44985]